MKEENDKDGKMMCTRSDAGGANWCSAKYMANKIGLPIDACTRYLNGPELSEEHALSMTPKQAKLFSNTLLTREAEDNSG